jgi:exo-beta-1,3-glucanase (GH17 family)
MRQTLAALNLPKTLEVGTSEAGSYFATAVLSGIDYGMANVHPWFANTTIADAAPWTFNFFAETDVAPAQLVPKPPTMWIAETGWPTQSTGTAATDGRAPDAEPGVPALQTFLDGFLCQANANGTGYFFFEFADEPWKDAQFGGVEGWWGIFNHKYVPGFVFCVGGADARYSKTLKAGLTIPTCSS